MGKLQNTTYIPTLGYVNANAYNLSYTNVAITIRLSLFNFNFNFNQSQEKVQIKKLKFNQKSIHKSNNKILIQNMRIKTNIK